MDDDAEGRINYNDPDREDDNGSSQEAASPDGERLRELGGIGEVLARVELELAYSSERLLNLDILLMHVVTRENDYETLTMENEEISDDSVEKGLEFDLLSGILDSEVKELENHIASLKPQIVDVRDDLSSSEYLREGSSEMERKLHDSEESLEQSLNQVAELRMQCDNFQKTLLTFNGHNIWNNNKDVDDSENDQFCNKNAKLKMQTVEQQRHILRMLEKSLARELDLEKKLSDSRNNEEELHLKLQSAEQEMFDMDEAVEDFMWRLFEAENAAEVLLGVSKGIMGRLQMAQFNLNGYIQREGEMKSKLNDLMKPIETKEADIRIPETGSAKSDNLGLNEIDNSTSNVKNAEDSYESPTASVLRDRILSLELQLKEHEVQLQKAKDFVENPERQNILTSGMNDMKNIIEDLKLNTQREEIRAETAEAKCSLLEETNLVLSEELTLLKSSDNGMEKVNLLEKELRESDTKLQHARASVEANQEQQKMLYAAIEDMENLINDLKSKVSKAESRVEISETNWINLSESNIELNEEIKYLRGRTESLELLLHQADKDKAATAKEINKRAKLITDLVMQLAVERERLHKQMSLLTKENKILAAKFGKGTDQSSHDKPMFGKVDLATDSTREYEEAVTESSVASVQVNNSERDAPVGDAEIESPIAAEEAVGKESDTNSMRRIQKRQLDSKYYFLMPILILLISAIAIYVFQPEKNRV
ncbi:hypothetical protein ACHQM5_008806 [Ranunculus cassubicifolius]